ncbi:MAG TPA: ATP-binding protein, partial [Polyangiaceae bacterium]
MAARLRQLSPYGIASAVVALSTAIAYAAEPYSELGDLAVVHLLAIVFVSTKFGLRVSVFACFLSILSLDFIFIPPRFEFAWTDAKAGLTFVAMMVVACVISGLTARLRREEQVARAAAVRAEALFQLHVDLSTASDLRQLVAITSRHLEHLLSARVSILLGTPEAWREQAMSARDLQLAERAWARRELTTDRSAKGTSVWAPLTGLSEELGVIGVSSDRELANDQAHTFLLTACANQFAGAMERVRLANAVHRTELEAEGERLRNSLLSAVSHDLKTPLTSIIAAGSTLLSGKNHSVSVQRELLGTIVGEGERLHRLINNLLSVARLDSPSVELRRTPESIEEIVMAGVARVHSISGESRISVAVDPNLPFVSAEPQLLEQVLLNLIENARRYAGADVRIEIQAKASDGMVAIQVADDGPGIPEDERDKVFEKFYRGRGAGKSDGGVGLGLTICRAIIRAHGGRISIRTSTGGGALVEFTLPVAKALSDGDFDGEDKLAS